MMENVSPLCHLGNIVLDICDFGEDQTTLHDQSTPKTNKVETMPPLFPATVHVSLSLVRLTYKYQRETDVKSENK